MSHDVISAPSAAEATHSATATATATALVVLLVEDDDGDAFLVEDILRDSPHVCSLNRVSTLAQARSALDGIDCVLLDLGLPDSTGLSAVHELHDIAPQLPLIVFTGLDDESRGLAAMSAGAQDYLVKGQVEGPLLDRAIRYSVERRRADDQARLLRESQLQATENARLERGLLAHPLIHDLSVSVVHRYRPGSKQSVLGGDFFDALESPDGHIRVLIGDVAGHGADAAALGVCLRVAWRTLVLAGLPDDQLLAGIENVLIHERSSNEEFATVCMLTITPDRATAWVQLAGHPAPLVMSSSAEAFEDCARGPALGIIPGAKWPASSVNLSPSPGEPWSLMVFTDGLIEGLTHGSRQRLGTEGLLKVIDTLAEDLGSVRLGVVDPGVLADAVIDGVEDINGGDLTDDVALVVVTFSPGARE